jgi:release factor glutamine methyltransferase
MTLRRIFKRAVSFFLVPATRWYLRKERSYYFQKMEIKVPPTVFHPGLFPSTRFLLSFLQKQNLASKSFLELGCGSGLISVWAAKQKAKVSGSDLNPVAVRVSKENAQRNGVNIVVFQSHLFHGIPSTKFDWIVINPPYYARKANNDEELAWNCGENFEYFVQLFFELPNYIHADSKVIMVLTEGCDILTIQRIAKDAKFMFDLSVEQEVLFDKHDFIFEIKPA